MIPTHAAGSRRALGSAFFALAEEELAPRGRPLPGRCSRWPLPFIRPGARLVAS